MNYMRWTKKYGDLNMCIGYIRLVSIHKENWVNKTTLQRPGSKSDI